MCWSWWGRIGVSWKFPCFRFFLSVGPILLCAFTGIYHMRGLGKFACLHLHFSQWHKWSVLATMFTQGSWFSNFVGFYFLAFASSEQSHYVILYYSLCLYKIHESCKFVDSIEKDIFLKFEVIWIFRFISLWNQLYCQTLSKGSPVCGPFTCVSLAQPPCGVWWRGSQNILMSLFFWWVF